MNRIKWMHDNGYIEHHKALMRGYVSRKKDYVIKTYLGRFGIGVKVIFPRYDSTQYVNIEYHIMDSGVLYVTDGCKARNILYDSFKNCKYSYKITSKLCTYDFPKNVYNIRLGEWWSLCD